MPSIVSLIKYPINKSEFFYYRIKHLLYKPKYPINPGGKNFIHLGCGEIDSPEFINIDSRFFPHIHHIHNVEYLPMFKDEFADLVYASHTLEHISMLRIRDVLAEWKRVLKNGGILRLSVPDFDKIIHIYNENDRNIEAIWMPLLGSQEYKENSHYSVFNEKFLTELLLEIGFQKVMKWDPTISDYHNFEDWASGVIPFGNRDYPISLNLEAIK